jgi:signal transduction histidine kinase/signal transduction protein with GAF and PtsI domain
VPSEMSTVGGDQPLDELRRELAEAQEQQAATRAILAAISNSPTDSGRVFAEIAASAARLCDGYNAGIFRLDGEHLRLVAHHGPISAVGPVGDGTLPLTRGLPPARAVLERQTLHVADLQTETTEYPEGSDFARRLGFRAALAVPLMRADEAIGVITIRRTDARPFTDQQVDLLKTFADQAVIAIENARLFEAEQARTRELQESLEFQTATREVLSIIGRSKFDLQPVLDTITSTASRLCAAHDAAILLREGANLRVAASRVHPDYDKIPIRRDSVAGRAVLERVPIHVYDLATAGDEFRTGRERTARLRHRTTLGIPLLRQGEAIGCLAVWRIEVHPFTEKQIELITTFADQAVIAIENTRLFEAEQTRTCELTERTQELTETLEYQTATSDVLNVISRSPSNLQPVLDAIVKTAGRLCQADFADFRLLRDGVYHLAATTADEGILSGRNPIIAGPGSITGRAALEQRPVHVPDVRADPEHTYAPAINWRTALGVPLLRDGVAVGVIVLFKHLVEPFTQKQIALVSTFADQALIAIENTRLFEEVQARTRDLTESLEYQTATSEVLNVISRSPSQISTVLNTIARIAERLCEAEYALIMKRTDDGLYRIAASCNASPTLLQYLEAHPVKAGDGSTVGVVLAERATVHLPDALADARFTDFKRQKQSKARTMLGVPLMRAEEVIGVVFLARREVKPFTDKQIELVTTFADQAVIAIENTRLFEAEQSSKRELQESLEYQTAISEVLAVISRSPSQIAPVMETIANTARKLCQAERAIVWRIEGDAFQAVAFSGMNVDRIEQVLEYRLPLGSGSTVGRAAQMGRAVQVLDSLSEPGLSPVNIALSRSGNIRTVFAVPLLRDSTAIGGITLSRTVVAPFTDPQIALVETFADQAVIAIENARLFEEVQTRTRELAKTVEDLEIASQHKSQFVANMSHELRTPLAAILGYAELMQEGFYEPQGPKSLGALTRIHSNGKHLLGLINTVLDIAKIESGQFTLNMAEYVIESVIETVRSATESLAQNKKLVLTTEVAKSLPIGLGDEQRLTQVLLNLVGNAIKFTDAGEVSIAAAARNSHFAISVKDSGPGIPLDQQDRIFDQFHQVDSSLTKAKGGTGLGLAIAKQIVEMHGGRIWVESTPGKGATFQMEVPIRTRIR